MNFFLPAARRLLKRSKPCCRPPLKWEDVSHTTAPILPICLGIYHLFSTEKAPDVRYLSTVFHLSVREKIEGGFSPVGRTGKRPGREAIGYGLDRPLVFVQLGTFFLVEQHHSLFRQPVPGETVRSVLRRPASEVCTMIYRVCLRTIFLNLG